MSKIVIKRKASFIAAVRKLNVNVNEQNFGMIANNQTKEFDITPGTHKIFVDMKGGKSNQLELKVGDNQTLNLEVRPNKFDANAVWIMILIMLINLLSLLLINIYIPPTSLLVFYAVIYFVIRSSKKSMLLL